MADRRRTFGPVVLAGLAAAGLAALAGSRAWATFDEAPAPGTGSEAYTSMMSVSVPAPEAPLVSALAFVVLAAWGVLLASRGRFRRGIAVLAAVTSAGMVVAAAVAIGSTVTSLAETFDRAGVTGSVDRTAWPFLGLAAALASTAATAAAVRLARGWPEMGSRYDAPGATAPDSGTDLDLWRALDEGRDPTLPEGRRTDP